MVSRRSFIAFLAGIPFFPTSLLPKKKPIVRTPWDILNEYVPPKEEKHMTEAEFDDFLEKHVNHRPWEVHCFDKRGKETLYISDTYSRS